MVNYHDGHIRSKRVAIGYIVNPSRRREGIGAEAVLAMLQFCFGYLGIHRVQAFIFLQLDAAPTLGRIEIRFA